MASWSTACIGLGANLGDRQAAIDAALDALRATPGVRALRASGVIETDAQTLPGAPSQPAYLNAAAVFDTNHSPRELLDMLLQIERDLGRERSEGARWEARTIDLDLLLYADRIIDEPGLRVPHPGLHERRFALAPLAQIAPDLRHPVVGKTVAALLADLDTGRTPPDPRRIAIVLALVCALGPAPPIDAAPPAPPPAPAIEPRDDQLDPYELLRRARAAYMREPVGEEVGVTLRSSAPTRREVIRWRSDPAGTLRIDLGDLVATATPDAAWIGHARWGRVYTVEVAAGETGPDALLAALPPIPLPQLALVRDESAALASVPPFCAGLEWFSATLDRGAYVLEGVAPDSTLTLELDETTLRVRTATMRTRGSESVLALTIECAPIDAGDPAAWVDSAPAGRTVESLASLEPAQGDVRLGDDAPDLLLLTREARPWRVREHMASHAQPVALLLFRRFDAAAVAARDALLALDARAGVYAALAAVIDPAETDPLEALAQHADRWRAGENGPPLLWTVAAGATIDRFAPDAHSVLVLIGRDGRIAAIVPLENRAGDTESLTREMVEALGLAPQ